MKFALGVVGAQVTIAGALVSGVADVANTAIAALFRGKSIALGHETFAQVIVLTIGIAVTGLAFAILGRRQRRW